MAEILQHETQEARALKSKASPFTAKAHAPQPLREAGYNKRLEADNWGKANNLIDKSAQLVQSYTIAKDKVVANETMELMQSDHANVMLGLAENLPQTPLDDLDLQDTVSKWGNRHNEDFVIGKADSKGKPTAKINSQQLEDYNIPNSQKDALTKYYNGLEKQKTDYLVKALPGILIAKAEFQLGSLTQKLKNQHVTLLADQENYNTEDSPGFEKLLMSDPSRDLSDEEVKAMGNPATEPSIYTLNLTPEANKELLEMFKAFDAELVEVMNIGVIPAEKAIMAQRLFTQDILSAQFDADVSRDEDGAYLKLQNGGYHIDRNLLWGTKYSKTLQQKMHLDDKYTNSFRSQYNANKQKERDVASKLLVTNAVKAEVKKVTRIFMDKDSYDTYTYKDVVSAYKKANGGVAHEALQMANLWQGTKNAYLQGKVDVDAEFQREALTTDIINDREGFKKRFSYTDANGQVLTLTGRKLENELIKTAEDRLKHRKYAQMSKLDKDSVDPNNITLSREEKTRISKAAKEIKPSYIQKIINTNTAHEQKENKNFSIQNIIRNAGSETGRNDLKARYGKFDEGRGLYYADQDKMTANYKDQGFSSADEMAIEVTKVFTEINRVDNAQADRLSKIKGVSKDFMPHGMFMRSMAQDVAAKIELLKNFSNDSQTQHAAYSLDPSKSFFNVNAEKYISTANGQKDVNFQTRYKEGVGGVLNPNQQALKSNMENSFAQLYEMEKSLMPDANTTKEQLEGFFNELKDNKSKTDVVNQWTRPIAANIKERLRAGILRLDPMNLVNASLTHCRKDDVIDEACITKWAETHAGGFTEYSNLPGGLELNRLLIMAGITKPVTDPDPTGQGVKDE
tara:strand:- start:7343 stop:9904 length:2562 start_codon:yes stop_codon:yes gene_type:complete